MVTIAVVGMLAMVALPAYDRYQRKAELSGAAAQLLAMVDQVREYRLKYGRYPNDSDGGEPPGISMPGYWLEQTPLGGNWEWEGPNNFTYAGIAISGTISSDEDLDLFDSLLDDGDTSSGIFQKTANGRPTFIIEDGI